MLELAGATEYYEECEVLCVSIDNYNLSKTQFKLVVAAIITLANIFPLYISFYLSLSGECTGGYKAGSLKLLNRLTMTSQSSQPIQICFGNTWIYICSVNPYYQWDELDAIVACRQLGYKSVSK